MLTLGAALLLRAVPFVGKPLKHAEGTMEQQKRPSANTNRAAFYLLADAMESYLGKVFWGGRWRLTVRTPVKTDHQNWNEVKKR